MELPFTTGQRCFRLRTGVSLTEIMVSCVLLASMMVLVLPMTMRLARQRQLHREMFISRQELQNQMERLTLCAPDALPDAKVQVSGSHGKLLRNAELKMQVTRDGEAARIQLSIQWTSRLGFDVAPQTLTAWVYPRPTAVELPVSQHGDSSQETVE